MKLFGFELSKKPEPLRQVTGVSMKDFAFSTPFGVIGKGNLSLPKVDRYYTNQGYVMFGEDNLYPQILNQMYYTSPIHGSIIDFIKNATVGGGYDWKVTELSATEKIDLMTFEKISKWKKLVTNITRDFIIHRRVTIKVTQKNGVVTRLERLDPSSIRNNISRKEFLYSNDWSRGWYDTVPLKRYEKGCADGEYIFVYQDETPGQDIYPIPAYNSVLNWCYLDGEIAFFQKSNIQNSVFPSIVVRRPKKFGSIEEIRDFKEELSSKTGAGNAGRILLLTGNGMDEVPEATALAANANDKIFETVSKDIKENICFGFSINPSIVGIKVSGSLGNAQELEMSYAIFEKNVIKPLRDTMEEICNDLLAISGVKNSIVFTDYQIIDKQIVETKPAQ